MKSICILRLSAIGDVCHAVAMVQRVRDQWPETAITWVIGKVEHQLIGDMPGIRFVVFDKKRGRQAYRDLKAELAQDYFDALLVMQVALRANLAAKQIRAKHKIGFDWQRSKEFHWLFTDKRIAPQRHAHVLDGFMAFADAIGVPKVDKPRWDIPISEADMAWAQAKRKELGPFIIISPAASKAERNWLPERYAAVANYLSEKGFAVVLCGGPAKLDRDSADGILQHTVAIREDLVGKTNLKQLLALLGQAELVIAPDTGPAHMATAVNTPVIGLYAHSNPRRTGPYLSQALVASVYDEIIAEQKDKPWDALPWGTRAKGPDLMARLPVALVKQRIDQWLDTGKQ
ncbi:glycosyltransferase family 9 protein [Aliiglaciecola sp. CAU 1673]|uniref:glycosyltransferase family 9 protein n=1 Tax=Aliiglaciecola sp. CAU 1673 TaxID=3032595 RepID=UPI0023DA96BC|nr:glycosyltransferase family 9 protein [Aliiglaciecola sp. CAU 1673]MDF2179272.1 glycosyltransferase family 9 protein [Aliiglaciecola sp. CAU 1673]